MPPQDKGRSGIDILRDAQERALEAAREASFPDFTDQMGNVVSGHEKSRVGVGTYPSETQDAYRLSIAERMGSEDLTFEIMRQDAEENAFQLWYRKRAMAEGLSLDAYDPLHMFDYKAYWRDALNKGTRPDPDGLLTKDFDFKTPEGEAEVIRRAKEAWGSGWSYTKPSKTKTSVDMRTGKEFDHGMEIEDLKRIQEDIDEFNKGKLKPGRKSFPLVKFKPGPPDPGGRPSYFETPILDEGVTSIQEQSEIEYDKLLSKGSKNKGGTFKSIDRQVPVPRPKDIKPDPATNAAPPEVIEQLRGMDPEIMNKLQQNPQLRSIFGLE